MEMSPFDSDSIIVDFYAACEDMIEKPADPNDPALKQIPEALFELASEDAGIRSDIVDVSTFPKRMRDSSGARYLIDLMIRSGNRLQLYEAENGEVVKLNPSYPLESVDEWKKYYRKLFVSHNDDFFGDITTRDVQSNLHQRYINVKLLPHIFPGELPSNFNVLDLGASLNLGLNWLKRNSKFPAENMVVYETDFFDPARVASVDKDRSQIMNGEFLPSAFQIGRSLGVEFWPMRDGNQKLWAAGCRISGRASRSEEIKNPQ